MSKKRESPVLEPLGVDLIDSHAHISARTFGEETDAVVARALASGLSHIINVGAGYDLRGIQEVMEVCDRYPQLHPTVGVHPHDAHLLHVDPSAYDRLREWGQKPGVVAWGEVGLDYYYDHSPPDEQRSALREQIRIARDLNLPIIVHDRDAHEEIVQIFDEEKGWEVGVVIHCFSGDWNFAQICLDRGATISLSGIVTFPNAKDLHEVAARVPLASLMVETDSPYLAPAPFRGRRNEPSYVHQVARQIAHLRGEDPATIAAITVENTLRFFGIH